MLHRCHPALAILYWLLSVLLFSRLPAVGLHLAALLLLPLSLLLPVLRPTLYHMRWLLLSLIALSGWTLPGAPLWPAPWAPSMEGLLAGVQQAVRLLFMALTLRGLWRGLGVSRFLAGLLLLLAPLRWLGLPASVLALRLALTLQYAELLLQSPPRLNLAWWRRALQGGGVAQGAQDRVELDLYAWQNRDWMLLALGSLIFSLLMWAPALGAMA